MYNLFTNLFHKSTGLHKRLTRHSAFKWLRKHLQKEPLKTWTVFVMLHWLQPWQPSRPLCIHLVPNSSQTLELGVPWGTQELKYLTETDSTISRPWTSPNPDNHSQLAMAGRGMSLLFFSLVREQCNKCPSLIHSLTQYPAGWPAACEDT